MSDRERILQDLAEDLYFLLSSQDEVETVYKWLQENWPS
jgi:hypothetical protein